MADERILEINGPQELEKAILAAGEDKLLILDFWAPWCQPCKSLGPVLEAAVKKFAPDVHLVKINVDENQALAAHFKVQSIPAVKFVRDRKTVAEFVGAQPASVVEQYITKLLPKAAPMEAELAAGEDALKSRNWKKALALFETVVESEPDSARAHIGMARCHYHLKNPDAARREIEKVNSHETLAERETLTTMIGLLEECAGSGGKDAQAERVKQDPSDLDAVFDWACCLAVEEDYPAACEALLSIVEKDRKFRDDEPRRILVALFDFIGQQTPLVREYRERLARALYV